jgi:O-antigen/teichoic acid export membrane protein
MGALTIGSLGQVWSARMYSAFQRPDASSYVARVSTRMLATYVFAGMGLCMLGDEIVHILAVPGYYRATTVMAVLTLAYFFWYASNLLDAPIWVFRQSRLKPKILLVSSAATLGLCAWLIPKFGAAGATYSVLIGLAVNCAVTYGVSQRVFRVHYEIGRISAMLALAVVITFASRNVPPGLVGTPHKLLLWAAWPVMLWCAGIVTPDEKAIVVAACRHSRDWLASWRTGRRERTVS